ncbi:hypothetical protein HUO13_32345 [Saccharopolyspora erythraea]|uniref:hypothetical protein n=1 Tax=Saccharopolyspora erythraea TaxID=1836 RepID=UPI001BABE9C4|nr:hypothetical protein [Saccharopolyspora erythraea]QUH04847.1 hypothetical protein HUO13_32345 [Saccharopolyspora erythraea]
MAEVNSGPCPTWDATAVRGSGLNTGPTPHQVARPAAARLHIAQPPLSAQLHKLETKQVSGPR